MSKFTRLQERDYLLFEMLYKHKYLDFNFINRYIYPSYKLRKTLLTKLRKLINDGLLVNFISEQKQFKEIDKVVYALTEDGYNLIHYKYDTYKYDRVASQRLKQGYMHHLVVLHILYMSKEVSEQNNISTLIFNERESYQNLNKNSRFNDSSKIIRPDGTILRNEKQLIILEYEHSNLKRDLFMKLTRYNDYFTKKLYQYNYSFGEYSKNIESAFLHLVTSKPLSKTALDRIISLELEYIVTSCTADEMLANPFDENNFKTVEKLYSEIINK